MQRLISTFPSAILLHKIYLAIIKEHNLYQTDIDRSQTLRLVIIFCSNLINSLGLTRVHSKTQKPVIQRSILVRIPDQSCHPFHFKAATESGEDCHPLVVTF